MAKKSVLAFKDPAALPGLTLLRAKGIHSGRRNVSDIHDTPEGHRSALFFGTTGK
jgi:hypothetical protein